MRSSAEPTQTHRERPLTAAAESTVGDGSDLKDEPGDFIETNCHWVCFIYFNEYCLIFIVLIHYLYFVG